MSDQPEDLSKLKNYLLIDPKTWTPTTSSLKLILFELIDSVIEKEKQIAKLSQRISELTNERKSISKNTERRTKRKRRK